MKTVLMTFAAFGVSVAGAYACPAHDAHAGVDNKLTVASVADEAAPMSTAETDTVDESVAERADTATRDAE